MHLPILLSAALLAAASAAAGPAGGARATIVVCAPGYPGTTEQAQTAMDAFARSAGRAAGWPEGSVGAAYHQTARGGIERIERDDALLALAPLPFVLEQGRALGLRPRLGAVPESGREEIWSLVAAKGRVTSPGSLAGWEITGIPGYSPAFVRGPVLAGWGTVPAGARITPTSRVVAALRRAASGEDVAVLVDRAQSDALGALPFGGDLEIVARSRPLPGAVVCTIEGRSREDDARALLDALVRLHETDDGADALGAIRMVRFEPLDGAAFDAARRAFLAVPANAR